MKITTENTEPNIAGFYPVRRSEEIGDRPRFSERKWLTCKKRGLSPISVLFAPFLWTSKEKGLAHGVSGTSKAFRNAKKNIEGDLLWMPKQYPEHNPLARTGHGRHIPRSAFKMLFGQPGKGDGLHPVGIHADCQCGFDRYLR